MIVVKTLLIAAVIILIGAVIACVLIAGSVSVLEKSDGSEAQE